MGMCCATEALSSLGSYEQLCCLASQLWRCLTTLQNDKVAAKVPSACRVGWACRLAACHEPRVAASTLYLIFVIL
jgi:hypothetical protein